MFRTPYHVLGRISYGTIRFLWVGGGGGGGFWGHPKIFELKGGPSQKLRGKGVM